jgi:hypothetical protein
MSVQAAHLWAHRNNVVLDPRALCEGACPLAHERMRSVGSLDELTTCWPIRRIAERIENPFLHSDDRLARQTRSG